MYYFNFDFDMYEEDYFENIFNDVDWLFNGKEFVVVMVDGVICIYNIDFYFDYIELFVLLLGGVFIVVWLFDGNCIVYGIIEGIVGIIGINGENV